MSCGLLFFSPPPSLRSLLQSQEALLEQCRQAGITSMALVSDKEGIYVKVGTPSFYREPRMRKGKKLSDIQRAPALLFFSRLCVRLIKEGSGATRKRFFFRRMRVRR